MKNENPSWMLYVPAACAVLVLSVAAGVFAGVAYGGAAAIIATAGFAGAQSMMLVWRGKARAPEVVISPAADKVLDMMERSNEARRISIRDESTGLLNRWYLERRLEEESARCKRYGYSMAVVVIKAAITHPHGILADAWQVESVRAAHRAAQVVRTVDLSASLAPFEFAICLVHCDRFGAERAIERLTAELAEYDCSAGIAVFPEDDCEPRAMIDLARVRSRRGVEEQISA